MKDWLYYLVWLGLVLYVLLIGGLFFIGFASQSIFSSFNIIVAIIGTALIGALLKLYIERKTNKEDAYYSKNINQ